MNFLKELQSELDKGFSKTDLENLIGLSKNSLSGIIRNGRKISKKSEAKITHWLNSKRPTLIEYLESKKKIKPTPTTEKSFDGNGSNMIKIDEAALQSAVPFSKKTYQSNRIAPKQKPIAKKVEQVENDGIMYDTPYFREKMSSAESREDLDRVVKLMKQKISGSWSQGQLLEYAQSIYKSKFDF